MLKHQIRLFFYKEKIFYWKNLNIFITKKIPKIERILVSFNIRNLKDIEDGIIVKFFYFLEVIVGKKSFIKSYKKKTLKIKNINLTGQVMLKGSEVFNFIDFFYFYIYPALKKNFIKINTSINSKGLLTLNIKDLISFPGLQEEYEFHYPIKLDIILRDSNSSKSIFFFKELGINIE